MPLDVPPSSGVHRSPEDPARAAKLIADAQLKARREAEEARRRELEAEQRRKLSETRQKK